MTFVVDIWHHGIVIYLGLAQSSSSQIKVTNHSSRSQVENVFPLKVKVKTRYAALQAVWLVWPTDVEEKQICIENRKQV